MEYLSLNILALATISDCAVADSMGFLSPNIVVQALYPTALWSIIWGF